jgi:hypothetical protein
MSELEVNQNQVSDLKDIYNAIGFFVHLSKPTKKHKDARANCLTYIDNILKELDLDSSNPKTDSNSNNSKGEGK